MKDKLSVFSQAPANWQDLMVEFGYKPYRSRQVRSWIYENFALGFGQMKNVPEQIREKLSEKFQFFSLGLEETRVSTIDGTKKYLWSVVLNNQDKKEQIPGGKNFFESVLIFSDSGRTTACISSQTGCNVGCSFCQSSKVKPVRNIPGWAIVEQYWRMCQLNNLSKIDNVVFMGMGEPFHNYAQVLWSADRFTDHPGFCLSPNRITISTSGILPAMKRFLKEQRPFRMTVSLNAPDTIRRAKIIPHAKKWDNSQLFEFAAKFYHKTKKKITFAYVLIPGFNDSPNDAQMLGKMLKKIPVKFNIIPFNSISQEINYIAPSEKALEAFIQGYLRAASSKTDFQVLGKKSPIMVRRSRGADINGACGQLAARKAVESG